MNRAGAGIEQQRLYEEPPMPQARHATRMLLSLAFLIAGCYGGGGGDGGGGGPSQISGLDARPSNTTCIAPDRATGSVTIGTQRAFPNLTFKDAAGVSLDPVLMLQAPGDSSRWFVVERFGAVRVFDNNEAVATSSVFIDITPRVDTAAECAECGLLGMAFHPDFPAVPRVYLTYTSLQHTGGGP